MVNSDFRVDARERLLNIHERPIELDGLVQRARLATSEHFVRNVDVVPGEAAEGELRVEGGTTTEMLLSLVRRRGIGSTILRLTGALNKTALDELPRMLLATKGVYESILLKILLVDGSAANDVETLRQSVVAEIDDVPRDFFARQLVKGYIAKAHLRLDDQAEADLVQNVLGSNLPLAVGRVVPAIDRLFDSIDKEGSLPRLVDDFAKKSGIEITRFTPAVRAVMVDYLETLGLDSRDAKVAQHEAYFVQAYHYAIFNGGGATSIPMQVQALDSDFDLDTFDMAPEQGVVVENVLAASALHYLSVLGDGLGIFALANSLILRRARGRLDLARGGAAAKLQSYKRFLRTTAVAPEERQLLAKRVFSYGDGPMLDDMVVNEDYPTLMDALMREAAEYIRKSEENSSDLDDKISRAPIDEAVRNLQYNLSYYAQDIAEDVLEIRDQFNMAKSILMDGDVMASVGSTRRNDMWSMIERLSSEELDRTVNVKAYRTIAVEGYKALQYVAKFDVTTAEDEFRAFIRSCQSYIFAKAALGDEIEHTAPAEEDEDSHDSMDKQIDDWED